MTIDILESRWKLIEKRALDRAIEKLSEQDYPPFNGFSIVTGFGEKINKLRRQHGKAKRNDKERHSRSC